MSNINMQKTYSPQRRMRGRSLIELLIAMLIALITMSAVLYAISGASVTGDQQNVYAQFNEEAALASSLLNTHFKNAGYSITRKIGDPWSSQNYGGPPVIGCENGFTNVATAPPNNCTGGAANNAPDAVVVRYEATADNSDFSGAGPVDCLGAAIAANTPSDGNASGAPFANYAMADNRYFVQNGSLMCAGGNPWIPQALINNVVDMQITYGVAAPPTSPSSADQFRPIMYLDANQVNALPQLPLPSGLTAATAGLRLSPWQQVVNVRICLELASEANALSDPMQPYVNCRGQQTTPTDRRLYRAINMVITLRNRAPTCADSSLAPPAAANTTPSWCPASSNRNRIPNS